MFYTCVIGQPLFQFLSFSLLCMVLFMNVLATYIGVAQLPAQWDYFCICLLARPPCAMVPESSIVLHFLPALDPLPTRERRFRGRFLMSRSHKSSMF